jgi:hypothetical protein
MRRQPLQCPFCDNLLRPPVDIRFKSLEITGGICTCRAVYVFDRKGHNLGEIYLNALTFLCKGDIDRALMLMPEDYEEETLEYEIHSNTISGREGKLGRTGKLFFVRLRNL